MKQSVAESIAEAVVSTLVGLVVAIPATPVILWLFGSPPVNVGASLGITLAFTVLSLVRGFAVRRFFNAGLHRATLALAGRLRRLP